MLSLNTNNPLFNFSPQYFLRKWVAFHIFMSKILLAFKIDQLIIWWIGTVLIWTHLSQIYKNCWPLIHWFVWFVYFHYKNSFFPMLTNWNAALQLITMFESKQIYPWKYAMNTKLIADTMHRAPGQWKIILVF